MRAKFVQNHPESPNVRILGAQLILPQFRRQIERRTHFFGWLLAHLKIGGFVLNFFPDLFEGLSRIHKLVHLLSRLVLNSLRVAQVTNLSRVVLCQEYVERFEIPMNFVL